MPRSINLRHAANVRNDGRLAALIGDHGPLGYGIYWMIIEMLHTEEFASMKCDNKMIRRMSAQIGVGMSRFSPLLEQLNDLYDLLEIKDGQLVSVITYRRPRKPAKAVKSDSGNDLLSATVSNDEENTTPSVDEKCMTTEEANTEQDETLQHEQNALRNKRQYSMEDLRFYEEIKLHIKVKAPKVGELGRPLTLDEAIDIKACYDEEKILDILETMHHTAGLTINYHDAYSTFKIFADKMQGAPNPFVKADNKGYQNLRLI